jgi:E3 ubiquitin-protein ligase MYCBP2
MTARPLLVTPNRFTRMTQVAFWNTGNGSPDAIAFCVDRPGIALAGICVYGGSGTYEYVVELLVEGSDDVSRVYSIFSFPASSFLPSFLSYY